MWRFTSSTFRQPVIVKKYAKPSGIQCINSRRYAAPPLSPFEGFLSGPSASYVEDMYASWLKDPASVHVSWQSYFKNLGSSTPGRLPFIPPPTLIPSAAETLGYDGAGATASLAPQDQSFIPSGEILDHMKVQLMVRAYQVRGHHLARLDPISR